MTEVCFECSDEKAVFMLKASRMFDGGYRDFIDCKSVVEKLKQVKKIEITSHSARCSGKTLTLGHIKGIDDAIAILEKEVM